VFLAAYLVTAVPLYLTFTTVGLNELLGMQGRYFIPLALLPVFTLASFLVTKKFAISSTWIIIFLTTTLSLNIVGIILAFYIPCGTTFYQSGLCYQPLYKDFSNETRLSPPISNEVSVSQQVNVACNGLSELRILLTPASPVSQGTTHFLLQNQASDQMLLDTSIQNSQVSADDWFPLRFDPDWGSAGKEYILKILSTDATTGQGLKLLYTPQSEFNLGDLYENGQLQKDHLVLQYGCVTGLRKIGLTSNP
jgi:hypothetical protein